eukprot:11500857-Alexandrium_andersonii.AAC.1
MIPLRSQRDASLFAARFKTTGPYEVLGNQLYCLIRTPQKVREAGLAVERATTRLAEILQVPREAL